MLYGPLNGPLIDKIIGLPLFLISGKRHAQEGMANLRRLIEDDIAAGRIFSPDARGVSEPDRAAAVASALGDLVD